MQNTGDARKGMGKPESVGHCIENVGTPEERVGVTVATIRRIVDVVSSRVRTLILLLVVSAILYVLISPLPEMTATKSVQPFVLVLALLVVIVIADFMAASLLNDTQSTFEDCCDFQAVLCSRLC